MVLETHLHLQTHEAPHWHYVLFRPNLNHYNYMPNLNTDRKLNLSLKKPKLYPLKNEGHDEMFLRCQN